MEFQSLNKVTLTEQVMQQLADKITTGQIKPGEKLPPERELTVQMGVSRTIIREAMRALSLIGLITTKPSGGSFVNDSRDFIPEETLIWVFRQELDNVKDIYDARELIETAVYLACFDNNPDAIREIRKYMDKINEAKDKDLTAEEFNQLLVDMDLFVAQNCSNSVFCKLMQTIILLRKETAIKTLRSPQMRHNSAVKRSKVVEAFGSGDKKLLEKALKKFYQESKKDFIFSK